MHKFQVTFASFPEDFTQTRTFSNIPCNMTLKAPIPALVEMNILK